MSLVGAKCLACGRSGAKMICSKCQAAHFCDRGCQKSGWASHKAVCVNAFLAHPSAPCARDCSCANCTMAAAAARSGTLGIALRSAPLPDARGAVARLGAAPRAAAPASATSLGAIPPGTLMQDVYVAVKKGAPTSEPPAGRLDAFMARARVGTPLTWAQRMDLLRRALDAGGDPNASAHVGGFHMHSLLWYTCRVGSLHVFELIKTRSRVPLNLDACTDDSMAGDAARSLLFAAVNSACPPLVAALLAAGADPHASSAHNLTSPVSVEAATAAAVLTCSRVAPAILRALVAGGMDMDRPVNCRGQPLLAHLISRVAAAGALEAAARGDGRRPSEPGDSAEIPPAQLAALFELALALGADPSARAAAPSAPMRPIDAIQFVIETTLAPASATAGPAADALTTMARALLRADARAVSAILVPCFCLTPQGAQRASATNFLVEAAIDGAADLVAVALEGGAHPDAAFDVDVDGGVAATGEGALPLRRTLLVLAAAGLSPRRHATALASTLWARKLATVRVLLRAGADASATDERGATARQHVAAIQSSEIVDDAASTASVAAISAELAAAEESAWARAAAARP